MKPTDLSALRWMLAFGTLAWATIAPAEEAIMSAPETSVVPPVLRNAEPPSKSRPADPTEAVFVLGPVTLRPHLLFRSLYGMGLPTLSNRRVASMIYTTAPGLGLDFGSHISFDYTPTWTSYTARALNNTLDHAFRAQAAGVVQDWQLQFTENFVASSPILVETGGQTKQTIWATVLGATRSFGSGLTFQTTASLNERYGERSPDTRDWATMNWLTLRFAPRLETGLGLGAGYSDIVAEPDATNERYMGRLNWSPTDKWKLALDGGVEVRHSRASAAKDMHNPIINASLVYQPFEVTKFTLANSRTVTNSYFEKQVTESANWSLSLEQRLLGRLFLSTAYSQTDTDYESVTTVVPPAGPEDPPADPAAVPLIVSLPGRSDRTESINARLTTKLFKRWTVAASYQRSHNRSSQAGFTFTTTQFGLEVGCRY